MAVRRSGAGWQARCPAHDDHQPSLSVSEGSDGRLLINCHAGCPTERVLDALGLTLRDLCTPTDTLNGAEVRYRYEDEQGRHLYDVVRRPGKLFHQEPANGRRGPGAMQGVRRVLYRLPAVIGAAL